MSPKTSAETGARGKRRQRRTLALLVASLLALAILGSWYLTSNLLRDHVRRVLVARLEQMTGGRVELTDLRWSLWRLEIEASGLTIHGTEPAGAAPLLRADRVRLHLKPLSFFAPHVGLRELVAVAPQVHLIVGPNGESNLPGPRIEKSANEQIQEVLDMSVERVEIINGSLQWNERVLPLDFSAGDFVMNARWDASEHRYLASVHAGRLGVQFENARPVALTADAQFSLSRNHLDVSEFRVSSDRSRLALSGTVEDFQDPRLAGSYHAALDLGEAAAVLRERRLHGGTLEISGLTARASGGWKGTGKITLRDAAFDDGTLRLENVDGETDFVAGTERLRLPHIALRLLKGEASGEAEVMRWLARADAAPSQRPAGSARFQGRGFALEDVLHALNTPDMPLAQLHLAGRTSGTVEMHWQGTPRSAMAQIALQTEPITGIVPGQVPVKLRLVGTGDAAHDALEITELDAATPSTHLVASGRLSRDSSLKVGLHSTDVHELLPFAHAVRGPTAPPLPFELRGSVRFNGAVTGTLEDPSVTGHGEADDVALLLPGSWFHVASETQHHASAPPDARVRIPWEHLDLDLAYSPWQLLVRSATLRKGAAVLNFHGALELTDNRLLDSSRLRLEATLHRASLAELSEQAGSPYPVSGSLEAHAMLAGPQNDVRGSGSLQVREGEAWGEHFDSLAAEVDFGSGQAQFHHVALRAHGGELSGRGGYNFLSHSFDFRARGSGFRLEEFAALRQPRAQFSGRVQFEASGTGTPAEPVLNGSARISTLTVNRHALGTFDLKAATTGREMHVTGTSDFADARVALDGTVLLRRDFQTRARITLSSGNLNPLLTAFIPDRFTGPTELTASASFSGSLQRPAELFVDLQVDKLATSVEEIYLNNDGPLIFQVSDKVLHVERCRLSMEGTRFLEVRGTAELTGRQRLNIRAGGDLDLKLLQAFSPEIVSNGVAHLNLTVNGTLPSPSMQGQLKVSNGAISYTDLPNGLSDINGTMAFNQNRLEVEKLTARSGGGELQLGGALTFLRDGVYANLSATGHEIRIRYPEGVSSSGDATLTLVGTLHNATLAGEITVTRFGFSRDFDFAGYLARGKQGQPAIAAADSPLNLLHVDLHVLSTPELQVQTTQARFAGNVDMRIRGTAMRPVLLGRVSVTEGSLIFNGTKYRVERGDITFTNPVRIEPYLDVEASARVRDYDITLGFHGSLDRLNTSYRSDPPLPTADIIALLALGRTREEQANPAMISSSVQNQATVGQSPSNALLGQALNAAVSSRVQRLFGVSRVKIDPQVGGPENNPNARLTVEQDVSGRVTLTYITNLSQSAQEVIQLEYNVSRDVSIVALRDQTGVVSFDVRVRKRKR